MHFFLFNRLKIYLKLFIVMGVCWILEFVSWASGTSKVYWYFTDTINLLHGVFIFLIFAAKRKVLRQAWNNIYYCQRNRKKAPTSSTVTTESSHGRKLSEISVCNSVTFKKSSIVRKMSEISMTNSSIIESSPERMASDVPVVSQTTESSGEQKT